jgi:hypothetical protein
VPAPRSLPPPDLRLEASPRATASSWTFALRLALRARRGPSRGGRASGKVVIEDLHIEQVDSTSCDFPFLEVLDGRVTIVPTSCRTAG